MPSYLQAIILGFVQGATELFPVSSLGHSVILPSLLGWNLDQSNNLFAIFLVATHLATSLVLLGFFWKDWVRIVKGIFRSIKEREIRQDDVYAKLGWLIVVATIPAGILGLLFEDKLKVLFALPLYAAFFLVLNGIMLFAIEQFQKKRGKKIHEHHDRMNEDENIDTRVSKLSWADSVKIGFAQCLALLPGFSRTGSTLGGGMLAGLDHEDSARFSFLLATPIIFAASVLKLPELAGSSGGSAIWDPIIIGFMTSAITAYFSVRFLSRYFKTKGLKPFAYYCIVIGILSVCVFMLASLHS